MLTPRTAAWTITPEVSDRIDAERRMVGLRDLLARLPAHEQRTIELVVWSGLSMAEAATAMGVAEGTVKSRLSRARGRLALLLDAPAQEDDDDRSAHSPARARPAAGSG